MVIDDHNHCKICGVSLLLSNLCVSSKCINISCVKFGEWGHWQLPVATCPHKSTPSHSLLKYFITYDYVCVCVCVYKYVRDS